MTGFLQELTDRITINKTIASLSIDDRSRVFIYGTGSMAQDVYRVLTDRGIPVLGFLDHIERTGRVLRGIPVWKPEDISREDRDNCTVILGVHNFQADLTAIIDHLNACGCRKIVSLIELYDVLGVELGVRYWLTSRSFYQPLTPVIEDLADTWADKKSRMLYRSILEFRITGDVSVLGSPDIGAQYHIDDIPGWEKPLRLIDCGAFDGDTLRDLIGAGITFEAVAAFEPDLANFQKLSKFVAENLSKLGMTILWPCGVHSYTTQMAFDTGRDMASGISRTGNSIIQCITLDDALPSFAPNLIKMDIEGAEYDALRGASELIRKYRPGLAISLYHRPEHLWQIPLLIQRIAKNAYRYYLRQHARNDFELVLYGIPQ